MLFLYLINSLASSVSANCFEILSMMMGEGALVFLIVIGADECVLFWGGGLILGLGIAHALLGIGFVLRLFLVAVRFVNF